MFPTSFTTLDAKLNELEDKCANYLEGAQDHPNSPPLPELEVAAQKIHDACLPLLEIIESFETEQERSHSAVSLDGVSIGSPDEPLRKFSFTLSPLSPLKRCVASLCHTTCYFDPRDKDKKDHEVHAPKELYTSSAQTIALLRGVLTELRGFDPLSSPYRLPSVARSTLVDAATIELPKARIAICDDQAPCRRILNKLLPTFSSGDITSLDSITTLREFLFDQGDKIDLLFLDNELGDGIGWDFILEMRSHFSWSKIFVVLITSTSSFNLPDSSDEAKMYWEVRGFDGFLGKPTSLAEIRSVLSKNFLRLQSSLEPRNWIKV